MAALERGRARTKMVQFNRSVMGGNFFRLIFKSDSLTDGTGLGMGKFMGIGQEHKIKGRRIGGKPQLK